MALQILKNPAALPDLETNYRHYATVVTVGRTGLGKIFGHRGGSVFVSPHCDPSYPVFQVIAPKWKGGRVDEWDNLKLCYQKLLQQSVKHRCKAVTIPLLAEKEPDFPASIDYKIAVDTIREFLEDHSLDVFLLVSRPEALAMPELRQDVERFLSARMGQEDTPLWSPAPFAAGEARFDTLVPGAWESLSLDMELDDEPEYSRSCSRMEEEIEIEEEPEAAYWEEDDEEDEPHPKKAAAGSYRPHTAKSVPSGKKAGVSSRSTGSLPDFLGPIELDAGFSETLLKLIDKTGKKDSEIYNKANVSRQHFSKIRNNPDYKPTKPTAVAFAIALELDLAQTEDLIGRAGYRLTRSSKFDVIIMYFIERRNYNMFAINEVLYEYDQSLLGA